MTKQWEGLYRYARKTGQVEKYVRKAKCRKCGSVANGVWHAAKDIDIPYCLDCARNLDVDLESGLNG